MCKECDIANEEPCLCICKFETNEYYSCIDGWTVESEGIRTDCYDCEHDKVE